MNNIMDGILVSREIKKEIRNMIIDKNIVPSLVVIQIGDNPASNVYIKNKEKAFLKHLLRSSEGQSLKANSLFIFTKSQPSPADPTKTPAHECKKPNCLSKLPPRSLLPEFPGSVERETEVTWDTRVPKS